MVSPTEPGEGQYSYDWTSNPDTLPGHSGSNETVPTVVLTTPTGQPQMGNPVNTGFNSDHVTPSPWDFELAWGNTNDPQFSFPDETTLSPQFQDLGLTDVPLPVLDGPTSGTHRPQSMFIADDHQANVHQQAGHSQFSYPSGLDGALNPQPMFMTDAPQIGGHQQTGHTMYPSGLGNMFDLQPSFPDNVPEVGGHQQAGHSLHHSGLGGTFNLDPSSMTNVPEVGGHQQAGHSLHRSGLGGTFNLGSPFMTNNPQVGGSQQPGSSVYPSGYLASPHRPGYRSISASGTTLRSVQTRPAPRHPTLRGRIGSWMLGSHGSARTAPTRSMPYIKDTIATLQEDMGGLYYEASSQSESVYSGHSAPAAIGPSTWTQENPQQTAELYMVAVEYLNIVNVVGPMLGGDPDFGERTLNAVEEAYRTIRPNTKTLPPDPDDGMKTWILSCAGTLNQRLLTYTRKRFPTDWRLKPFPSENIIPDSAEEIKYKRDRIAFYLHDLRFTRAEEDAPIDGYQKFNHPSLRSGYSGFILGDKQLGLARPLAYRNIYPHSFALYISAVAYQFQCEDEVLRGLQEMKKITKPQFKNDYKYVYDAVLRQLRDIRATPEGPELNKHFATWAKAEFANFSYTGQPKRKRTVKRLPSKIFIS